MASFAASTEVSLRVGVQNIVAIYRQSQSEAFLFK